MRHDQRYERDHSCENRKRRVIVSAKEKRQLPKNVRRLTVYFAIVPVDRDVERAATCVAAGRGK